MASRGWLRNSPRRLSQEFLQAAKSMFLALFNPGTDTFTAMYKFPKTAKGLRTRIAAYRKSMQAEWRTHKYIDDGAGKRYLVFWLYFVLGDWDEARSYFRWYATRFPDDVGEPVQKLCWALSLRRMGERREAVVKLADLMLSNLYAIPALLGDTLEAPAIWHDSNLAEPAYAAELPVEIMQAITAEERQWVAALHDSLEFRRLRKRYIDIAGKLLTSKSVAARVPLVREADALLGSLRPDAIPGAVR